VRGDRDEGLDLVSVMGLKADCNDGLDRQADGAQVDGAIPTAEASARLGIRPSAARSLRISRSIPSSTGRRTLFIGVSSMKVASE
jgi:hypothetical protein